METMTLEIDTSKTTPMMAQWAECRRTSPGALLLFRLGDFYEAFYDDAELISRELSLTLTERQGVPMCGVPWHSSDSYIDRLVAAGYRVAIAEQLEDPKKVKGLVRRKVVRTISPGSRVAAASIEEKTHNFFASLSRDEKNYGLALLDSTTATFVVFEASDRKTIFNELARYNPQELLATKRFLDTEHELVADIRLGLNIRIQSEEEWRFESQSAHAALLSHFHLATLDGFGMKGMNPAISAAGALLRHFRDTLLAPLDQVKNIQVHVSHAYMMLDRSTLSNLELTDPIQEGKKEHTLLHLLDKTKTPMGGRLLAEWIRAPLTNVQEIQGRHNAVEDFLHVACAFSLDDHLKKIRDLERLIIRIGSRFASPREYVALRDSLEQLPAIQEALGTCQSEKIKTLSGHIHDLKETASLIRRALRDDPPYRLSDGDLFRENYCPELDELRHIKSGSTKWLADYQNTLRETLGIKTLRVGYTRMFGYYIEVSRAQAEKMPASFSRRQTLVNGERYISEELKQYEEKILSADERIAELEDKLYSDLRDAITPSSDAIIETAQAIAEIDVLRSLAICAEFHSYSRPEISDTKGLTINSGRHPVIEAINPSVAFVPNDTAIDGDAVSLMLITGPNMAGKSTYIRQVALITIMAQIGSFVPATSAHIGIVDKLFSRIGASDDLARGQSTFMVEMAETASILNQATDRSLVLLDEIGRGTSTYDGISIAWAVAEYLLKTPGKKAKTLFATHYYELTDLETQVPGVKNFAVRVAENHDGITFLHKIAPGKADRSYGIHVAQIAGLPASVVERAWQLLHILEEEKIAPPKSQDSPHDTIQMDLFSDQVLNEIRSFDLNGCTPVEAFSRLIQWQKTLK
jgi:DNA mismatch repair protein MutS